MRPGATLRVYADLLPASDGTAPFAIHTFNQITGGDAIFPRQAAIANDHFVFTGRDADEKQTRDRARVRARHGLEKPVLRDARRRHLPLLLPRAGPGRCPGSSSRAPIRTAAPTAPTARSGSAWARRRSGSAGRPATSTSRSPSARRVVFTGTLQPWVSGKDIVLELLRRWGAKQSQGMSVEFVDAQPAAADRLPQHDREHDGGGRGAERHLRARRDHRRLVPREGHRPICRIRRSRRAPTRSTRSTRRSSSTTCVPMIAKPFSPGNAFPADEVARERHDVRQGDDRLVHQRQLRRPAAGGARDSRGARREASTRGREEFVVFPGSGGVARQIERPEPRLGGESIADVFRSVGGQIRESWCGPCFGQGPDALAAGPARDHVVQPQLAEPHGRRRRRLPREPRGRRGVGAGRLHGAAQRAGSDVGSRTISACNRV